MVFNLSHALWLFLFHFFFFGCELCAVAQPNTHTIAVFLFPFLCNTQITIAHWHVHAMCLCLRLLSIIHSSCCWYFLFATLTHRTVIGMIFAFLSTISRTQAYAFHRTIIDIVTCTQSRSYVNMWMIFIPVRTFHWNCGSTYCYQSKYLSIANEMKTHSNNNKNERNIAHKQAHLPAKHIV